MQSFRQELLHGMNAEIGFWTRDPEGRKLQVNLSVFGGNLTWTCKSGHHQPWLPYEPNDEDWDHVLKQAQNRLARRLVTHKCVDLIRQRGR